MKTNLFKPILLAIAVLFAAIPLQAQMVSNNNDDEVNKVDQYAQRYRPGQVIVKFRENSSVNLNCENGKLKSTGVSAIDKVMTTLGITDAEKLMPLTGDIKNRAPRKAKALSGREIVEPNLSKLYCLKFEENEERNVLQAVEMLKELKDVEFAEPNYLVFIQSTEESTTYQSEPMFSQQWGLNAINMPQLWEMPKTDETRPIIAILDTGVDITHPDLADNIWTNPNEADGADYEDDDNNGYVDDVHGWDFVAGTAIIGNGMDRNGHGTHCAGIAAAVGDNGIGITGANPDALILPIKVMTDYGIGDAATICRGIDYATACGANILSMSFGSPFSSEAMYQSLCKSLTNYAVLVGAAGNNGKSIYDRYPPDKSGLHFPGAYDIVIGVMASGPNGQRAGFSNYDPDGPFYSKDFLNNNIQENEEAMLNYDVMAPGFGIISTYLNGSYRNLSGTSMATPMVAGAISRILQVKGFDYAMDQGLMGDMAMAKDGTIADLAVFNAYKAVSYDESNRQVALALIALEIDDSEGDGDGQLDAGETISLWPTIRSMWGHADNIKIAINPNNDNVPNDVLEVLENNVDFGWSLNSHGSYKSKNPIRIKVNDNANDGLIFTFRILLTSDNGLVNVEQEIVTNIENGIELSGVINEDLTLYPDKHYIVTKSIAIPAGRTLTIMPGTRLEFYEGKYISSEGSIVANGKPDSLIVFTTHLHSSSWGGIRCNNVDSLSYCKFENLQYGTNDEHGNLYLSDCVINQMTGLNYNAFNNVFYNGFHGTRTNFIDSYTHMNTYYNKPVQCFTYSNFVEFFHMTTINWLYSEAMYNNLIRSGAKIYDDIGNYVYYLVGRDNGVYTDHSDYPSWLGSGKEEIIRPFIYDSMNPYVDCFTTVDLSNMPTRPYKEAHGIIWKVVVDGYDAQDEFDLLPPLGVGRHKFEVYYNRDDIDTTFRPKVSMGLRQPYTQTPIDKDGFWCVKDSASVYTVFLDITGKTNCDGLNRIKVTGGKDHDHFDVPDEYTRFNVLVQAVGSMATGFAAEAGMGNVKLTWNNENNDFEDAMGFNVYRYAEPKPQEIYSPHYDDYGNYWEYDTIMVSDTIRLNQMILDLETTSFTDYEVTPGETYYYYYKVLSTDLKEYDISNVVAATPLTSTLGDANASGEVDVADVITTVNYAAGMEPRPFIFEAADVNVDTEIDILDVIGIIRIITNPNAAPATASIESVAEYWVKDGVVWLETPVDLAGVQVSLDAPQGSSITPTEDLNGFEKVSTWLADNDYLFLAYNMAGRTISAGRHPILNIGANEIADIRLSDTYGHNVMATPSIVTAVENINADGKRAVPQGIYDLMGRKISSRAGDLNRLPHGIYIVNGVKVVK